jgi:condensin complex subunit 2
LTEEFLPDLSVLDRKAICHSLAGFSFSKNTFVLEEPIFLPDDDQGVDGEDDEVDTTTVGGGEDDQSLKPDLAEAVPVEDFFTGDQAVYDDYVDGDMGMEFGGIGVDDPGSAEQDIAIDSAVTQPLIELPRIPNERDLVMAMTDADGDGVMLDYFDQNFLKNWAGPEHWKLRKVVRKQERVYYLPSHFNALTKCTLLKRVRQHQNPNAKRKKLSR